MIAVSITTALLISCCFACASTPPSVADSTAVAASLPSAIGIATAEDTRMMEQPDIHGDQVVFVYAGDL